MALVAAGSTVVWLMLGYRTQALEQRLRDAAGSARAAAARHGAPGGRPGSVAAGVAPRSFPAQVLVLDAGGRPGPAGGLREHLHLNAHHPPGQLRRPAHPGTRHPAPRGPRPAGRPAGAGAGGDLDRTGSRQARRATCWSPAPSRGPRPARSRRSPRPRRARRARPLQRATGRGARPPGAGAGVAHPLRLVLAIPQHSLPSPGPSWPPGWPRRRALALLGRAVAWWLAASITRPVQAVTQAARRLARGQPHQPVPERGAEEIAQLARNQHPHGPRGGAVRSHPARLRGRRLP